MKIITVMHNSSNGPRYDRELSMPRIATGLSGLRCCKDAKLRPLQRGQGPPQKQFGSSRLRCEPLRRDTRGVIQAVGINRLFRYCWICPLPQGICTKSAAMGQQCSCGLRPAGVEPTTFGFGGRRSIQLSYGDLNSNALIVAGVF